MAFSCSAFVWRYLAVPCYSNRTMKYKAAGGCSCSVPPPLHPPLLPRHIISHLNRILAEWSWGRWNRNVHRPLTILCLQEISCPLCLSLWQLGWTWCHVKSNILSKLRQVQQLQAVQQLCQVVSISHCFTLSLSLTPSLYSIQFLHYCNTTLDLSKCCKWECKPVSECYKCIPLIIVKGI